MMKSSFVVNPENTKILVCCHKKCELPSDDLFLPIQVGKAIAHEDLGIQGDDTVNGKPCDNISAMNPYYCELTGIYWAWKNIRTLYPNLRFIGLCHYRRYFTFNNIGLFQDSVSLPTSLIKEYQFDHEKLSRILGKNKIILAKPIIYPYPLRIDYSCCHMSEDYRFLLRVMEESHREDVTAMYDIMERNNKLSPYNMFIMSIDSFEAYCSWLFDVLDNVERLVPYKAYNAVQRRVFGYMGERLLNIWVKKNKKPIKFLPIIKFDESPSQLQPTICRGIRLIRHIISTKLI